MLCTTDFSMLGRVFHHTLWLSGREEMRREEKRREVKNKAR
jgi:hypothetical protein